MTNSSLMPDIKGTATALSGRSCAEQAGLPHKVAIDALCRMRDTSIVNRIGRKYSARWALADLPEAARGDFFAALEGVWHARRPLTPTGEGAVGGGGLIH